MRYLELQPIGSDECCGKLLANDNAVLLRPVTRKCAISLGDTVSTPLATVLELFRPKSELVFERRDPTVHPGCCLRIASGAPQFGKPWFLMPSKLTCASGFACLLLGVSASARVYIADFTTTRFISGLGQSTSGYVSRARILGTDRDSIAGATTLDKEYEATTS